ncbi:hypothetical protein [Yersinia pekkanenii]|uniref:Uncharacterized protein n=1 Tax=Yersinia pekkanenii TaxID=1288385 RepID=A0A0T9NEC3_9GAMM|nr:hypothetical protein [Yersinia pekkanenii]CNH01993.1 Uncharacterised protein [Yersinia pekkanenii]CRY64003.1 Uncharacterised protein [Yersinia pekkanenii]
MGKSPSIEEMEKKDKKSREYLNGIADELTSKLGDTYDLLEKEAEAFYTKGHEKPWVSDIYITGKQFDYQSIQEWSLASVASIINKISSAVIGTIDGKIENLPAGTDAGDKAKDINKKYDMNQDKRLLIATNCFNLLAGIVGSFGNATSITVKHGMKSDPIGGGLRIFGSVGTQTFQRSSFFNNEKIATYQFAYIIKFSVDEFELQAKIALIDQYQNTLNVTKFASDKNDQQFYNDEISYEQWSVMSGKFEKVMEDVLRKIRELDPSKKRGTQLVKAFIAHDSLYRLVYESNKYLLEAIERREAKLLKI